MVETTIPNPDLGIIPECGNGRLEDEEECDPQDFEDLPCEDTVPNAVGGLITCDPDLCVLNTGACEICPASTNPCDGGTYDFDRFKALELNCNEETKILNEDPYNDFVGPDVGTWFALRRLGAMENQWTARGGNKFLAFTTGRWPILPTEGTLVSKKPFEDDEDNNNPGKIAWMDQISPLMNHTKGADLPFQNCKPQDPQTGLFFDCSNTLEDNWLLLAPQQKAEDVITFSVDLLVPEGAKSFSIDFAFLTADDYEPNSYYPTQDLFIVWLHSPTIQGNVAYLHWGVQGEMFQVVNAMNLEKVGLLSFYEGSPALEKTTFDNHAGTDWLTISANVTPGEPITLVFVLMDHNDPITNTATLLDNFRWNCDSCDWYNDGFGVNPCGVSVLKE